MDETTTRSLSDEDIETVTPGSASTVEERPRDEDGTDSKDADGTDGDAQDGKNGDSSDSDSQDADGTDQDTTGPTERRELDHRSRAGLHRGVAARALRATRAFIERVGTPPGSTGRTPATPTCSRTTSTDPATTSLTGVPPWLDRTIAESEYTRSGTTGSRPVSGMVDPARVFELFRQGATIVLQGLHRYWEPVTELLRGLELELGHRCQVNAYVTPPGAQGLALHEDPHDVFVLQAFGRSGGRCTRAGEAPREPPTRSFPATASTCRPGRRTRPRRRRRSRATSPWASTSRPGVRW
jgi:hypothetical protein